MTDSHSNGTRSEDSITYVIGLWIVEGNRKRSREHYFEYLPATLRLLKNKKIIFFHNDDSVAEFAKKHIDTRYCVFERISISSMMDRTHASELVSQAKKFNVVNFARMKAEKGLIHYRRDLIGSGEQAYKQILSIWLSKVFLVTDIAIEKNPFLTSAFAWVDASLSRFNSDTVSKMLKEPVHPSKALLARSGMRYKGEQLRFNAGFILAPAEIWLKLRGHYDQELMKSLNETYPVDEEVILNRTAHQHPNLIDNFDSYGNNKSIYKLFKDQIFNLYYKTSYRMFIFISRFVMPARE